VTVPRSESLLNIHIGANNVEHESLGENNNVIDSDMDQWMKEHSTRMMHLESDMTRVMTVLFGNPDIRAHGMADKVDAIDARLSNIEGSIKRAAWILMGVMLAGQGAIAVLSKIFGL
jgi:hypothetical protein